MPSIDGGDSTDRSYAPHMWILGPGGDPVNNGDYQFVGNLGSVFVDEGNVQYHVGANVLGELICDAIQRPAFLGNIPVDSLSPDLLRRALDEALDINAASSSDRQQLIRSLAASIPELADAVIDLPKVVSLSDAFRDPLVQEKAGRQIEDSRLAIRSLRTRLGFSNN